MQQTLAAQNAEVDRYHDERQIAQAEARRRDRETLDYGRESQRHEVSSTFQNSPQTNPSSTVSGLSRQPSYQSPSPFYPPQGATHSSRNALLQARNTEPQCSSYRRTQACSSDFGRLSYSRTGLNTQEPSLNGSFEEQDRPLSTAPSVEYGRGSEYSQYNNGSGRDLSREERWKCSKCGQRNNAARSPVMCHACDNPRGRAAYRS